MGKDHNKNPRYCLYCQEPLKGRSDKKFCNASCRSAYHNQYASGTEAYIKRVNRQLRKNRAALHTACPKGKATIRKSFLKQLGMDFTYFTHTWRSYHGVLYFFCYDYGYSRVDDDQKVLVVQEQDYMRK